MNLIAKQKEYWDSAIDKAFTVPFDHDLFESRVSKTAAILDFGCGYGRTLKELASSGYSNLTGMDFSEVMLERAKNELPEAIFIKNEGVEIPAPDASFDAVIALAVFTSIAADEDQEKLIREILRVLKPGGVFYFADFLLNEDERNLKRYEKYQDKYGAYGVFELPEGAVLRHHESKHIAELTAPFIPVKFRKTVFVTMNGHESNGFHFLGIK